MKSNFNKLFKTALPDLKEMEDINIEEVLNDIMPQVKLYGAVTKTMLVRELIRGRLTTALNAKEVYSYKKGHFVSIYKANEDQLKFFQKKAERDAKAAEARKEKALNMANQISMSWDENGKFIGYNIPNVKEA